ncbi:DUF4232 domain-containing protein (plasmid) [Streptomyces sp. BI20]|uniref:DUF4232 domain-containing protein n=1 Tax=Streptomyces sp. BI20 TaxID=3403460 RepID=UPI003C766850
MTDTTTNPTNPTGPAPRSRSLLGRVGRAPVAFATAAVLTLGLSGFAATQANAATVLFCTAADVKPSIVHGTDADPDPDATQTSASLLLTNTGKRTCVTRGFVGLDLIARNGDRWSVARQKATTERITLKPGVATMAELIFLPWHAKEQQGSGAVEFKPVKVAITPPDTTTTTTVAWPWPTIGLVRQDGATHPGTWLTPLAGTATS